MPQQSKNAASARLTCVMCGGDNALDATQCEHCAAALQPALDAASSRAASTRAATKIATVQDFASPSFAVARDEMVKPSPTSATAPNDNEPLAPRAVDTSSGVTNRAAAPNAVLSAATVPVSFSFAPLNAATETAASPTAAGSMNSPETSNAAAALQKPADVAPPKDASTRAAAIIATEHGADATEEVRAQALLDRAFRLAEVGDMDAAILACSEAAALQPQSTAPPTMLALLLERAGDSAGAIRAYQRTLKIAPDNRAARDSLTRLQVARENPATDAVPNSVVTASAARAELQGAAHGEYSQNTTNALGIAETQAMPQKDAPLAETSAASSTTRATRSASTGKPSSGNADDLESATQNDISALSQFLQDISSPNVAGPSVAPLPAASVSAPKTRDAVLPDARVATRRDSYFLRSVPLAAVALLGIWFLLASRRTAPIVASTREAPITPTAAPPVASATDAAPASPEGQSVQEQLAAAVAAAQAAPQNIAPTATPLSNVAPVATATPLATPPAIATPPMPPSPTAGAVSPTAPGSGAMPMLPPQNATPAGDSSNFERALQLQQRALDALEAGGNDTAARGFESAIEAYNAQIATGFRADEARAAIAACRDGIQLARQMQSRAASPS